MKLPRRITSPGSHLRVCLAQIDVSPGQPARNTRSMLTAIQQAREDGATMVIFPEMAVPGYLLGDTWEQPAFLNECENCGRRILEAARDIAVVFGNVGLDRAKRNEDGRIRKYNALFVAAGGRFHGPDNGPYDFAVKTLMPNYREFDDSRHFYDLRKLAAEMHVDPASLITPVTLGGLRLGCVLCEDAWDADYNLAPLNILSRHNPHLYLNCSCSPFTRGKNGKRRRVFATQAAALQRPLIYVNAVGLQNNGKTVYVFDGASCIYQDRSVVRQLPAFTSSCETHELALQGPAGSTGTAAAATGDTEELFGALREGARRFLENCGAERVVVGLSGGIDSALTAAIYAQILPPENLLAVNLPTQHNSPTTIDLARRLAKNLDCLFTEIPIGEAVELTRRQLHELPLRNSSARRTLAMSDTILENVQARDRSARVLAALAGAFDAVFTCNANKAEATVGYTTLYGDLGGFFALLADLWKGDVYRLADYLNREVFRDQVIPAGCFNVTPSAELSAAQAVDQGLGDPLTYPYHDRLFASWVEWWDRATPEEILEWRLAGELEKRLGFEGRLDDIFHDHAAFVADLECWWRRFQGIGLAKRIQAPPVMAVTRRAFGFDLRESQNRPWFSERYRSLKRKTGLSE